MKRLGTFSLALLLVVTSVSAIPKQEQKKDLKPLIIPTVFVAVALACGASLMVMQHRAGL